MHFRAADTGAAGASPASPPNPENPVNPVQAPPPDYKALLLQLLDLDPAADDAAIQAAFAAEEAEPEDDVDVAALQQQAASAADLQTQLDAKNAEVTKTYADMDALRKQQAEAQADEILKVYEGQFTDEASKAAIRNILISDREAGIAILNGLKKPEAAVPSGSDATGAGGAEQKGTPPSPQHDTSAAAQQPNEQELANKISTRAREIVKNSNPKISMTKAYAQAERELKAAA